MKPILYHLGHKQDGFGWGLCNTNLSSAMLEFFNVRPQAPMQTRFKGTVFVPIPNHYLELDRDIQADLIIGYCFTELPLPPEAVENAKRFHHIFTGSDWNTQRLQEAGILHCSTLVQGVDFERFKPQEWPEDMKQFRVFSGGKFEFRKGQDYVIAAMREFMNAHPDTALLTSWNNLWPQSCATMSKSWLVDWTNPFADMPENRIVQLPQLPNAAFPLIYKHTHVGLFPNRCEAGTNLVLMEYMASSRPVIATDHTGHWDALRGDGPWKITTGDFDHAGWFNPSVSNLICALEEAYQDRAELMRRGEACRKLIEPWTWARAAQTVFRQVQRLQQRES